MTDGIDTQTVALLPVEVDPDLARLLIDYPLPDGVEDADMNQTEIASSFNTSVNTVGKWIKAGMPVVQEGGNGMAYVLRLSHCHAWRAARDAEEKLRRTHSAKQQQAMQASFLNFDIDDPRAEMTAKQRQELAAADIAYSRAMQMRRQLVQLEDVVDLLGRLFGMIRDKIEGMPDILERELSLKPEQLAQVNRIGDDLLGQLVEEIEAAELNERDVEDVDVQSQWVLD